MSAPNSASIEGATSAIDFSALDQLISPDPAGQTTPESQASTPPAQADTQSAAVQTQQAQQPGESTPAEGSLPPDQTLPAQSAGQLPSLQQKIDSLERIIASNPMLRAHYLAQEYGVIPQMPMQADQSLNPGFQPFQQPGQQPQFQPNQSQAQQPSQFPQNGAIPGLPEDGSFDPYDTTQMLAIIQHALTPFASYIQQTQQQDQLYQRQQQEMQFNQQINTAVDGVKEMLNKELPGIKEIYAKPPAERTMEQKVLLDHIAKTFEQSVMAHPREIWMHPKLHQHLLAGIVPQARHLAARLGLQFNQPNPANATQNATVNRQMYVESSHVVPPANKNEAFEKADKAGNIPEMIRLIGIV